MSFPAMAVSLGRAARVTARVTFDKKKAAEGGFILAAPELSRADLEAIRMSEGVVTTSGGLLSFASLSAREHAIAAVILSGASWEDGVLVLARPVFGASKRVEGFRYQLVEKTVPLKVHEGDVVAIDARSSAFEVYPPGEMEGRLSLAQAMRAYDGLRDPQSLIQWFEGASDREQAGPWLIEELGARVAQGGARSEDFLKVLQAVKVPVSGAVNSLWTRSLKSFMSDMKETQAALETAGSAEAVSHLLAHASLRWESLRGLRPALYFSGPDKGAAAAARRVQESGRRRAKALGSSKAGLEAAAASAGAAVPRRVEVDAAMYRRFIEESRLGPLIDDLAQNSSLGLRRKSERIRAAIRKERFSPGLSQDVRAKLPAGWMGFFVGSSPSSPERLDASLRETWASLWSPASLGARERQGRRLAAAETGVFLQESVKGEVSGLMMTRDLASGSRSRMTVDAVRGGLEEMISGRLPPDQYTLSRAGREALPAIVADRERGRVLDVASLERLARLGAALEDHYGRGSELRFAFSGRKLYLLDVRPSAEESPLSIPASAPGSERPAPDVSPVRSLVQ